jgi:hypothetical protein
LSSEGNTNRGCLECYIYDKPISMKEDP